MVGKRVGQLVVPQVELEEDRSAVILEAWRAEAGIPVA